MFNLKHFSSCALLSLLTVTTATAGQDDKEKEYAKQLDKTHAAFIGKKNTQSIEYESDSWSCWSLEEYAEKVYYHRNNPTKLYKRELAFNVFKAYDITQKKAGEADKTHEQLLHDLSVLCGQTNREHYLAKTAFKTTTELGIVNTCLMLSKPSTDVTAIARHQAFIKALAEKPGLLSAVEKMLQTFATTEHMLIHFWEEREHFITNLHRDIYYNKDHLAFLNTNEAILQISGLGFLGQQYLEGSVQVAACYILALYSFFKLTQENTPDLLNEEAKNHIGSAGIILNTLHRINQPTLQGLIALAGSGACGYYAVETFTNIRGIKAYLKTVANITRQTALSIRALHNLTKTLHEHDLLEHPSCQWLKYLILSKKMSSLCTLANQPCFDSEEAATSLKNFGKTLSFLWQFLASKEQILAMLTNVGFVDTMAACAKNITNETNPWCFTSFTTSKQPLLVATNFWHPLINGQAVKNNLTLGYQDTRPHAIITGPNEAGKSTTMKAIATLTLCSQTLGICSAESFVITPFTYIKTYLNINDDLGIGNSLFKAEIKRAQELIETIKNAPTNHFGLFVFDEMCSGTTPIEGAATAYSIAKQVGYFDNSLCLIATHFDILTRLGFETNRFTNFNVSALQQADGSFVYPRKLEEGISNQHIALDILRNEGFAGSLVDDATNIVRSISGLA